MIGSQIQHYRILEKLGEGGMGEVFLAEDTKLDRKVALKFLPPHYTKDPEFKARFEHEAKAAAALNHPNIITVYELNEHEGRLFIAMEYVQGHVLETLIREGKLTLAEAVRITAQVSEGLGKAHAAGVIHRDIKPSNILIDSDGRARVLDFGLATSHRATTKTPSGTTMGTLMYEAPEQMSGQATDRRSDLYAVGAVLYQMIAGRPPFTGEYEAAIRAAILNDKPEPLARYKSNVPDDVQRIVSKLLEKDPKLRYQTAEDLLADLTRLTTRASAEKSLVGRWATIGVAALVILVTAVAYFTWPSRDSPSDSPGIMLAVLPFQNLGDPADEYFADGITDEITSRLSVVDGLGVISRTSAMHYKSTDKGLPEIAKELGVGYVLEGTVRWEKSSDPGQVRVTPRLIRVSDNTHLWAENYERSFAGIFTIQTEIATNIVEALDITLVEPKRRLLDAHLTDSPEAYDYFLRGVQLSWQTLEKEDCLLAIKMFEKAIELDPDFASAHAGLAGTHLIMYWYGHDPTPERVQLARGEIEKALAIDPDSPAAHQALAGYYYWGLRDYDRALQEFELLKRRQPSSALVYAGLAAIQRRQGRWDETLHSFGRRTALDPRYGLGFFDYGFTCLLMRDYEKAGRLLDIAISLSPHLTLAHTWKALYYIISQGDVESARRTLYAAAGKMDTATIAITLSQCDMLDRQYDRALDRLSTMVVPAFRDTADYYLNKAQVLSLLGDSQNAKVHYDSARAFCERHGAGAAFQASNNARLAMAYAGLGQREQALAVGRKAVEQLPVSEDAMDGPAVLLVLANINVMVGEYDAAIDQLDYLLTIPSELSVHVLELEPTWDPLRDLPRFRALLARGHTVF